MLQEEGIFLMTSQSRPLSIQALRNMMYPINGPKRQRINKGYRID